MFWCTLLCVRSSIAIILMGKRELVALLYLSSWCLVMVERLFLVVPQGCLRFVIVVFPDNTHFLFFIPPLFIWRAFLFRNQTKRQILHYLKLYPVFSFRSGSDHYIISVIQEYYNLSIYCTGPDSTCIFLPWSAYYDFKKEISVK